MPKRTNQCCVFACNTISGEIATFHDSLPKRTFLQFSCSGPTVGFECIILVSLGGSTNGSHVLVLIERRALLYSCARYDVHYVKNMPTTYSALFVYLLVGPYALSSGWTAKHH